MEKNKNKKKLEFTVKNVNKIGAIVVFILVFIFTFLLTCWNKGRDNVQWIAIGVGSALFLTGIAWLVFALLAKKRAKQADPNKLKIEEAIKKLDKQEQDAKDNQEITKAEQSKKEENK